MSMAWVPGWAAGLGSPIDPIEEVLRNRVKAAEDRVRAAGRYYMSKKKKRRLERGLREAVAALVAYQLSKD